MDYGSILSDAWNKWTVDVPSSDTMIEAPSTLG